MNTLLFPIAAVLGLGASELAVVMLIMLMLLAVPAGLIIWMVLQQAKRNGSGPVAGAAQKKCPDCAELVLAEARVCKHCGYRFDRGEAKNT